MDCGAGWLGEDKRASVSQAWQAKGFLHSAADRAGMEGNRVARGKGYIQTGCIYWVSGHSGCVMLSGEGAEPAGGESGGNCLHAQQKPVTLHFVPLFPLSNIFTVTKVSDKSERHSPEGHCLSFPTISPLATGTTVSSLVTVIIILSFSPLWDGDTLLLLLGAYRCFQLPDSTECK